LSPAGPLQFNLPDIRLSYEFKCRNRAPLVVKPVLNSVLIDTWVMAYGLPATVELVWCASTKAPRKMLDSLVVIREKSEA